MKITLPATAARPSLPAKPAALVVPPSAVPALPFNDDTSSGANQLRSLDCLTAAVYYEARSESDDGQRAVAQVVLNRVRHPAFPASVCGVVFQGSSRRTGCQFTFTCDGSLARRPVAWEWQRARAIAASELAGSVYTPIGNATHYHTRAVLPYWSRFLTRSAIVGAHIFYRWNGAQGETAAFNQRYAGIEPLPAILESDARPTPVVHGGGEQVRWHGSAGVVVHRGANMASEAPDEAAEFGVRIHRSAPTATVS